MPTEMVSIVTFPLLLRERTAVPESRHSYSLSSPVAASSPSACSPAGSERELDILFRLDTLDERRKRGLAGVSVLNSDERRLAPVLVLAMDPRACGAGAGRCMGGRLDMLDERDPMESPVAASRLRLLELDPGGNSPFEAEG